MTRTEDRLSCPTDAASSLECAIVHFALGANPADPKGEIKNELANSKANFVKRIAIAIAVWGGVLIGAIQSIP